MFIFSSVLEELTAVSLIMESETRVDYNGRGMCHFKHRPGFGHCLLPNYHYSGSCLPRWGSCTSQPVPRPRYTRPHLTKHKQIAFNNTDSQDISRDNVCWIKLNNLNIFEQVYHNSISNCLFISKCDRAMMSCSEYDCIYNKYNMLNNYQHINDSYIFQKTSI